MQLSRSGCCYAHFSLGREGLKALPNDDLNLGDIHFKFVPRPSPLAPDLRAEWRFAAMVLILKKCWGNRATLRQLHVLKWAVRTARSRDAFLKMLGRARNLDDPVVRFEPSLNRAISFALAEQLVSRESNGTIRLTAKGSRLADEVMRIPECLDVEKEFLNKISGKVSQRQIDDLLSWNSD
jgi:hypothetical protein